MNLESTLKLRIDWSEMDTFGHVNNVMYFKYVQASRVNFWELSGFHNTYKEEGIGPMLASTQCQFMKPLFYPGEVILKATVEFVKNTSFGLKHELFNGQNEKVAEAHDVIVVYDFTTNEKTLIPDWLRNKLNSNSYEKF